MKRERLYSLDVLKALCSFLVLCIHAPFPGTWGRYVQALSRIAVPVFFLISGYFYTPRHLGRRLGRLLLLFLSSNLLYFLWRGAYGGGKGWAGIPGLLSYARETLTRESLKNLLLFQDSPFVGHLWFLGALLVGEVIVYLFDRAGKRSLLYLLTPFLLLADLVLGKYSLLLLHRTFDYHLVRNAYFVAVPNLALGMCIRERKDHTGTEKRQKEKRKIERQKIERQKIGTSNKRGADQTDKNRRNSLLPWLLVSLLVFSLGTCLEKYLLIRLDLNPPREQYLSTTFLALTVFLLFLELPLRRRIPLSVFGERYAGAMYVLHMLVMDRLVLFVKAHHLKPLYLAVRPAAVYLLTIPLAILVSEIIRRAGRRREQQLKRSL